MKLVGASWSFIRRPFLRRNVWSGVLAAVVADAILMGTAYWAVTYEQELLQVITPEVMLIDKKPNRQTTGATLILRALKISGSKIVSDDEGPVINTWLCAYISINKYLRMRANTLYYI